jgi:endonuclease G
MSEDSDDLRAAIEAAPDGGTVAVPRELLVDLLEGRRAVRVDPDYAARPGYDEDFLGSGVPLPTVEDGDLLDPVLPYHHFSVGMSRTRKLARFTAVNIDGRRRFTLERGHDVWAYDPRIPREAQAGPELYSRNPLDRGHLVRRLDPVWGRQEEAVRANDDTFHWTNCAPQHAQFNQNDTTWQGLEDYVLNNASGHRLRVSVFSGPVLRSDDPAYRGVQLPREFWKVVATAGDDGGLRATAYLLSQETLIEPLEEEAFAYGAFKTFQVPVTRIEEATALSFGELRDSDPLGGEVEESTAAGRPLDSLEAIDLG